MTNLLYIGNNLTRKTKYYSSMELLCQQLKKEGYNLRITSNKVNKFLRLLDMSWTLIKNRNKIDFVLIDTFSTSNFYYAFLTSQLSRIFKLKYILILRGGNLPMRLDHSKTMSNRMFNHSYKNIAPSHYLKFEFEKRGYQVSYIPNILNIDQYTFIKRDRLEPSLLFVRAFHKTYNPEMAIHVLNQLKLNYPKAKLCMIGPSKDDTLERVKKLAVDFRIDKDVEFTGVMSKTEWHKKSEDFDIFINTTNFDNTPVSVMEAMALGLPVVSTNVGGLPYLIDHDQDGILVNKNDVEDMNRQIQFLLNEPKEVERITKKARVKVEQFDWDVVRLKWIEILKS